MKILFIHQNFPGQFKYLVPKLITLGHEVQALTIHKPIKYEINGLIIHQYKLIRNSNTQINDYLKDIDTKLIRAESCLKACISLKENGFIPDIIIAHGGWGEALLIKECWPQSKIGIYCEYYYNYKGADVGFDLEFQPTIQNEESKLRFKNINNRLNFEIADAAISPTQWQATTYPKEYRKKITVIHDGINTIKCSPNEQAYLVVKRNDEELKLKKGDEVITFINRNLEPYRGYHIFMRCLSKVIASKPNAKILIIGGSNVSYGFPPEKKIYGFDNWKDVFLNEISGQISENLLNNIYFFDHVDYEVYINMLQVSMIHVYLTYPFVLSWSMLESMSIGCTLVASDTSPVQEVIINGYNGELVNFFDHENLANKIISLMNDPVKRKILSKNARETIKEKYDLENVSLPKQIEWVKNLYEKFN